jgi:hypothetical protein
MKNTIKRLYDIPSMAKLGQRRRMGSQIQYEHEVLTELAQLSREKTWLNKEKDNWQERISRIDNRLLEIGKLEETLIQKQMAMKEQVSPDIDNCPSDKKTNEMIIKY